jgi:hypothetical protein
MTSKNPAISPAELSQLRAARSEYAKQEFQHTAQENAWRTQLMAPFIPATPAIPELAHLDEKTRGLLKGLVEHQPERDKRYGKPRSNDTLSFDGTWVDVQPPGTPVEWYGPDASTGRVGAKLISQAQGDRSAASMVCKLFTADRDGTMGARVHANISFGYADVGGMAPSSARSRGALGVWIDQFPNGPYGIQYAESELWYIRGLEVFPGWPWFKDWHAPSPYSTSVGLAWPAQAGVTYAVWSGAAQFVGTWGPAGAQSNVEMYITDVQCAML